MNLDDALQTFVIESRELLEAMEEALLKIEQAPDDADLINAIFRAAHTIKGSAGLFGLDHMVSFTHEAENVLDMVRGDELRITPELIAIFLDVCDLLTTLVDLIAAGTQPDDDTHARSAILITRLKAVSGQGEASPAAGSGMPVTHESELVREGSAQGDGAETDNWHISLRFGRDVLRNGMDPASFIRYLATFGRIASIVTLTDTIPAAAEMEAEDCYLGFEIGFQSDADKTTIEAAFEFVRDDARIHILPPHSKIDEYLSLIDAMPEETLRLGEILVRCGTLTTSELDSALKMQASAQQNALNGGKPAPSIGEMLVEQQAVAPAVVNAALQKQKQVKDNKAGDSGLIRVNADKLDEHINLIGELIIAAAGINLTATRSGAPELIEAASVMNRLVENVRDSALQLRMVQIGATLNKFQRVVRDVSKEIGKDIRLEISGAETELDKTVVEKIGDPLTHLVRNSMDHGIEPADVRLARGKPAHGTLRLNAYHDSGSIAIEVADDGGGLDKERILAKAIEKGLVKPEQQLTDNEIHNLIFEPGFSTAAQINNLSGRGVGMDVVRRNITALRGSIEIDSTPGVGSTMRIRLPLTLAIIDGFLVSVANASFIVPLEMVVECVELTPEETRTAQGRNHLDLRGEILPFIRLRELFELADQALSPADELNVDAPLDEAGNPLQRDGHGEHLVSLDPELLALLQPTRRENVVVVNYAGHRAGLVVDDLMGEYQTVIRPLGAVFNGIQGISGFTILGSGMVALILDVPGLVRRVAGREGRHNARSTAYALTE